MSVFHRVRVDLQRGFLDGLSAPRFFELAERLPAYQGVLQARVQQEQQQNSRPAGEKVEVVPGDDIAALAAHEAFDGLISYSRAP
jgi:hypothetical protein